MSASSYTNLPKYSMEMHHHYEPEEDGCSKLYCIRQQQEVLQKLGKIRNPNHHEIKRREDDGKAEAIPSKSWEDLLA